MKSSRQDISLLKPNVERDAPFAYGWFARPEGHATLLSMGNSESEIERPSLESEKATLKSFVDLENQNKQITRMIVCESNTIGAVWIELFKNHGVKPPSIHMLIGDPDYRGRGIGKSVFESAINYVRDVLGSSTIYSRHLVSNLAVTRINNSLGFQNDGSPYIDKNGLQWQNIVLTIKKPVLNNAH